ncbi:MAG: hypothetical protein CSA40_02020 [Flavobacteriales bacterium]|nr:MAG: hypothetical protein CSA40_02020 [Flavobacteriales bacterium]
MTIQEKVLEALSEIRPFLQKDGGDIALVSIVDKVVTVQLMGYCQSCSKQLMTLNAITEEIKRHAPEIEEVVELEEEL